MTDWLRIEDKNKKLKIDLVSVLLAIFPAEQLRQMTEKEN